jgi:uncharacterized protein YprB with RNaseH-like and TPR domain
VVPEGEFRCRWYHPLELDEDLNAAYVDIEATNLDADFGQILSYAIKPQGKQHVIAAVIQARTLDDEKLLLEQFLADIKQFNCWSTYYGTGFDIPFLRARCMYHGLSFPGYGSARHYDLYYVARARMKLASRRLQRVSEFLGIEGKTPLRGEIWVKASLGDKEALKYILDHNIEDVRVLEKVHARLEPFMKPIRRSI